MENEYKEIALKSIKNKSLKGEFNNEYDFDINTKKELYRYCTVMANNFFNYSEQQRIKSLTFRMIESIFIPIILFSLIATALLKYKLIFKDSEIVNIDEAINDILYFISKISNMKFLSIDIKTLSILFFVAPFFLYIIKLPLIRTIIKYPKIGLLNTKMYVIIISTFLIYQFIILSTPNFEIIGILIFILTVISILINKPFIKLKCCLAYHRRKIKNKINKIAFLRNFTKEITDFIEVILKKFQFLYTANLLLLTIIISNQYSKEFTFNLFAISTIIVTITTCLDKVHGYTKMHNRYKFTYRSLLLKSIEIRANQYMGRDDIISYTKDINNIINNSQSDTKSNTESDTMHLAKALEMKMKK